LRIYIIKVIYSGGGYFMKRLLSIVIALILVFTTCMSVAYADSPWKNKKYNYKELAPDDLKGRIEDLEKELKKLKEQLKEHHKNQKKKEQILKEIAKWKKKYNKHDISVIIDGKEIELDVPPILKHGNVIKKGRMLVPIGPLAKALGAKVNYHPAKKLVTVEKDGKTVEIWLKSGKIILDGKVIDLGCPAESIKGRTMVPISFILKFFKHKVEVDEDAGTIIIDRDNVAVVNNDTTGNEINQFKYSEGWTYKDKETGVYENDIHWTNKEGASFQIKFNGTGIKIYGVKGPDYGSADIYIDDMSKPVKTVNCYSSRTRKNVQLFSSSLLPAGEHTMKVVVKKTYRGSKFAIDRAEINECAVDQNLALGRTVVASSEYSDGEGKTLSAAYAVDGKAETRWSSKFTNDEWIYVDLGTVRTIGKVVLKWEKAFAKTYKIQLSNDAKTWEDAAYTTKRTGDDNLTHELNFTSLKSARYVRMLGVERATQWGYSLWEFEVYGSEQNIGGSLSASSASVSGNVNLSSSGVAEWVHWAGDDAANINRKKGVAAGSMIEPFTKIGDGSAEIKNFQDNRVSFSWVGGTPTASGSNVSDMICISGAGNGFLFMVPADTTQRTLKVYVGVLGSKGKLEASLSDGSASEYTGYIESDGIKYQAFTIKYRAASAGQKLIVKYTVDAENPGSIKNVMLQAAAVQ
jgi:hypothetical protein